MSGYRIIIVKRVNAGSAETAEIRALAEAAGHEIVGELTQVRSEDSTYNLGQGAIKRLSERIEATAASGVIFDNELSPQQAHNIGEIVPDGIRLIDRYRLILDIFEEQAGTREAQLQVQLAELHYELPRVQEEIRLEKEVANERRSRGGLGEKENRRVTDIKERIQRIEEQLGSIDSADTKRREQHRDAGLSLVALAGYTNAGKSTLLRRLADDLAVDREQHTDLTETAGTEDRLFKTLGTTTRRATLDGRAVLVTDTIGFIRDLPGWLVQSFESTLGAVRHADLVCLVIDASDPLDDLHEKVETSRNHLADDVRILPVLNKVDVVDDRQTAREAVSQFELPPAAISAVEGTGVDDLCARIRDALPEQRARFVLSNSGETMRFVSWAYDHADVRAVDHDGETVSIELVGHPSIVRQANMRAKELTR
ncbi:GTPase HflX [Halocatena marina]|uniref:GTPase HflX n=1 Tax=Halocatena marina TaxID=2934937 RepID=A0ABD5YM71_9EURY|nr:GTPase HflX [Halocatena marina]